MKFALFLSDFIDLAMLIFCLWIIAMLVMSIFNFTNIVPLGLANSTYMYKGNQNSFINKVSECFLTNVAVEYGADRFTAYEETTGKRGKGSPPQKSKLTLQFTELEVLSQDHIKIGH